ncbi:MAG: hypothetical protein K2Q18_11865 [Bdellovibrionales bacterium]|nr:hypothetical protein [Bdellovibrionales bacterium]
MKTTKLMTTLLLVLSFNISSALQAQEITIPGLLAEGTETNLLLPELPGQPGQPGNNPFLEGTERELSVSQIQELLPWAKNSKLRLEDLLKSLDGLSATDKIEKLVNEIKYAVIESAPKNSELFMRYTLNRALALDNVFLKEMNQDAVGSPDIRLKVLLSSVKMALRYYDTDVALIEKRTTPPYASYGIEYFRFLNEVNKSVIDASAQYEIGRTSLAWYQNDLFRDLNQKVYAPSIYKINDELRRNFPERKSEQKVSDAKNIIAIRQMKGVIRNLIQ